METDSRKPAKKHLCSLPIYDILNKLCDSKLCKGGKPEQERGEKHEGRNPS